MVLPLIIGAVMGAVLGLLGGGGSVLLVPALVYLLGIPAHNAIALSLGVVGSVTLVGGFVNAQRGLVHTKAVVLFGSSSVPGAILGAQFTRLVPESVLMWIFAVLMVVVAALMSRGSHDPRETAADNCSRTRCLLIGFGAGALMGFLGVGGGFIVVPALVLFAGIPTKKAIGSSLLIVSISSFAGLFGRPLQNFNWSLGGALTVGAVVGMAAGMIGAAHLSAVRLRFGFAIMILAVAGFVIYKNS